MPTSDTTQRPIRKLLITGGSGHVGRKLRKEFGARFETIRILDQVKDEALAPHEESMVGRHRRHGGRCSAPWRAWTPSSTSPPLPVEAPFERDPAGQHRRHVERLRGGPARGRPPHHLRLQQPCGRLLSRAASAST